MRRIFLMFLIAMAIPFNAMAHSMISSSNITEGAILQTAPQTFDATFGKKVGLIKVSLATKEGKEVDINYKSNKKLQKSFTVPLPQVPAGDYILSWRAIAQDGHVMSGDISFSIKM